jgi:Tol biopolymer transport system component
MSLASPWTPTRATRALAVLAGASFLALPLLHTVDGFAAAGDLRAVTKEASGVAHRPSVANDGRAFFSTDARMLTTDANSYSDAYESRPTGAVRQWSAGWRGAVSDGSSVDIDVAAAGNVVTFSTSSTNLWGADNNRKRDVYVCKQSTGTCQSAGWVAWGSEPNGHSFRPRISADGKWVVFASDASNWVDDDTNGVRDIFLASVANGKVSRVSLAGDGSQLSHPSDHPHVNADGTLVTFSTKSAAVRRDTNGFHDIYLRDLSGAKTTLASRARSGALANQPSFRSAVAKRCTDDICRPTVAFVSKASNLVPRDTNNARDVFIREGTSTGRASVSSTGAQGRAGEASWWPTLSSDGRFVGFVSHADLAGPRSSVPQVLLRDRTDGKVTLQSALGAVPGNRVSDQPSLSANGRYLAFRSKADNLDTLSADNGTWDVFVRQVY